MPVPQNLSQLYESFLHLFSFFILLTYIGENRRNAHSCDFTVFLEREQLFSVIMILYELLLTCQSFQFEYDCQLRVQ